MASQGEPHDGDVSCGKQDPEISTESWMSSLPAQLQHVPLSKLAIPGTHDSGTFCCDQELAPDAENFVAELAKIPFLKGLVNQVIHRWAQCQRLNFTKQLESGLRFFDLRVSTRPDCDDLYLVHTVFGPKVSTLVQAVVEFLQAHPREVVLLDFNHFFDMQPEHHIQLITHLIAEFGSKICHRCAISDLTLNNLWGQGKQVIIFYQNNIAESFEEMWLGDRIKSLWANTDVPDKCIKYLDECFSKPPATDFTVCQGVLTPSNETVIASVISGRSLENLSENFQPLLCHWVEESPKHCAFPLSIVTADFAENRDLIRKVINLNYKRMESQ